MSGELSLFGDEQPKEQPVRSAPTETSLPDWLVNDIRAALTVRGLTTMIDRQWVIESAVQRPVESLRSLTRAEALRVLALLKSPPKPSAGQTTSAWDTRDGDTWIDRL